MMNAESAAAIFRIFFGITPIHAAFTPTSDEVAWARRVIELMSAAGGQGAVALDGRMIDRPHVKQAERILAALEHR